MQEVPDQAPGRGLFAAGTLADELNRPVNDRDFDVALHIVFQDRKATTSMRTRRGTSSSSTRKGQLEEGARFDSLVQR